MNAGPRALVAFTAENADVKFTFRAPVQSETHEELPSDVHQHVHCRIRSLKEQASDMQSVMAALAGYFGSYTSKM